MPAALPQLIRLEPDGSSVAEARRFARDCVCRWGLEDQAADVELVVDELVTNAIRHSRGAVTLSVGRRLDRIVVQVQDASPDRPEHEDADVLADNGRGLLLVEQLAAGWGTTPVPEGKRVWAELPVD
ncbi:MAG TPA: ATP-binding protein [Mycobacteriales bacterium]|nr:ATP-binding protein [Mycobacteriales bacterium]